jgi:uncharacterized protein YaiE (UPF0345 family)
MIEERDYFGGKVKTLACDLKGEPFRVGVLLPGNYTFGTSGVEEIEIIQGTIEVALPDGSVKEYKKGGTFTVEADRDYNLSIEKYPAAYLCKYK